MFGERYQPRKTIQPLSPVRSTVGIAFGLRGGMNSAIVMLSCRRDDPARTLFVRHEWEQEVLDFDTMAKELETIRKLYRPVLTVGYYGGKDDEKIFRTLSIRLGQHVEPAPADAIAPTQFLVTDFRSGRLRAKPESMVVRDAKAAIWRDGVPDQTGILAALRCADWGQQQFRQKKRKDAAARTAEMMKEQRRRISRPY